MKIAQLNVRIDLQASLPIQDEIGNWIDQWQTVYSCFAKVDSRGQSGGEVKVAGLVVDHSDLIFTIRYTPNLKAITTTAYRILFEGELYDIQRVDFMNYEKVWLKLYAKKVSR